MQLQDSELPSLTSCSVPEDCKVVSTGSVEALQAHPTNKDKVGYVVMLSQPPPKNVFIASSGWLHLQNIVLCSHYNNYCFSRL